MKMQLVRWFKMCLILMTKQQMQRIIFFSVAIYKNLGYFTARSYSINRYIKVIYIYVYMMFLITLVARHYAACSLSKRAHLSQILHSCIYRNIYGGQKGWSWRWDPFTKRDFISVIKTSFEFKKATDFFWNYILLSSILGVEGL